jgi:alkyl hydroperoxide reductase subunit AhpC
MAVALQAEEERVLLEAQDIRSRKPAAYRNALMMLGDVTGVVQRATTLHGEISKLLARRELRGIDDVQCLRSIVAMQQECTQLASDSLRKVKRVLTSQ